jgi:toxin ParE1/3/4
MSPTILISPSARHDLAEVADYLEVAGGLATAERYLAAVGQALARLAGMPSMGSPWQSTHPRLQDVRAWPVPGFRKYLIFYRPLENGIDVLRVIHGARDSEALLEGEQ